MAATLLQLMATSLDYIAGVAAIAALVVHLEYCLFRGTGLSVSSIPA